MSASNNMKKKMHSQTPQNVKVVVRIRPITKQEDNQNVKNIVKCHSQREMFLRDKKYTFDRVFKPSANQIELYMSVIAPLIQEVVEGYNCTVFAYGQTGTGKTYTMTGEKCNLLGNWKEGQDAGIIPRAAFHIFDELSKMTGIDVNVKISYIELYNEEIRDLLCDDENTLQMYTDTKGIVSIPGVTEIAVHDGEGICKLLQRGIVKRQIAPTLMNHQSSRSHTVFTISIITRESTISGEDILKSGKINLVDLAGNENIARSGCKDLRATELANINRSLLTLGRVIHALVDKAQKHVPYRDSKLTRILQDSLGGHTKTVIIATVSPAHNSYEETSSTLEYATRAKDIKNTPTINKSMTKHDIIDGLVKEIDRLRKDLDAARSGSGFYVDKENHQKMLDAISIVTGEPITAQELTDQKAQRIQDLEHIMYSRVRQFEETVEQCKKHQTELETARTAIKDREELIEQEKFLSKWYENQSSDKFKEAQKLLSVTKTLHSEKEILLSKLEHQFNINESNEIVTKKALTEISNKIDQLGNEESKKIKILKEIIKDELTKNVLDLYKDISDPCTTLIEKCEQCKSRIRNEKNELSVKNCISTKTSGFFDAIRKNILVFENVLSEYEQQLNVLKMELPKMVSNCRNNTELFYEKAMTLIKSSDDKLKTELNKPRIRYLKNLDDQEKQLIKRKEEYQKMVAELNKKIEEDTLTINKIKKDKEELIGEMEATDCISEIVVDLEKMAKESAMALEKCTQLPNLIDMQNVQVQDLRLVANEFEDKLNEIASFLDEKHERITQKKVEEINEITLNSCKVIKNTLEQNVNNLIKSINVLMEKTEMVESFTATLNNLKQILYEQILAKNIKAKHEGDTPIRQSTSYPSRILDVAPRESLIEKFKRTAMTKMEEADNSNEDSS